MHSSLHVVETADTVLVRELSYIYIIQSVLFNREVPCIIRTYTCTVGHGVLCLVM